MPNSFLLGPPSTITRWFSIFDNTVYICLKQLLCRTTKHVGRPEGVSHKVSFYDQDPRRSTKLEIYVMITYQMVSSPVFNIWGKLAFHWFQTLWLPTWPPPRPPWHYDFHPDHYHDNSDIWLPPWPPPWWSGACWSGLSPTCATGSTLFSCQSTRSVQSACCQRALRFRNWSFNCAFAVLQVTLHSHQGNLAQCL